ncbi:hypothetical protein CFOL_v3_09934 [Cephalotus follicularis]|uniref:Uncharacterized protein n=1 Tax=Cephalotus follicularis TaxID=3775 RepID=A0A1Q3BEZ8_CEPFO|nr:hypothetical protein CFOL_v3_09934 [Cephalotus follicularis]
MSMTPYKHKFLELSHYAPALVANQEERCQRFLDSLRPEIRHSVATIDWNVFGNLVESAMRVELSINEQRSIQDRGQNSLLQILKWRRVPPRIRGRGDLRLPVDQ